MVACERLGHNACAQAAGVVQRQLPVLCVRSGGGGAVARQPTQTGVETHLCVATSCFGRTSLQDGRFCELGLAAQRALFCNRSLSQQVQTLPTT